MPNSQTIFVEFETLGEVEVSNRVEHKVYDEPTRAYAMRWLNDRAMARVKTAQTKADYKNRLPVDLAIHAQRAAKAATIGATAAIVAAVVAAGAAYVTLSQPTPAPAPIQPQFQSLTTSTKPPAGAASHHGGRHRRGAIGRHGALAQ